MKDLNIKLPFGMEIDHRSFRPSFVVDGPDLSAWEEDCWTGKLRIGEVVFTYNKPCVRCIGTKVTANKNNANKRKQLRICSG